MGTFAEVGSSILLFTLVFGMSATVDVAHLRKQLRNRNALLTGISLQFVLLPFLGFLVVKVLKMSAPMGISLLVVTSSPGGSYSNWWCSMFNADLALSVTMTAISTLLSVIMLPVNLVIYAASSYSSAVVKSLDWYALFLSIVVVIGGISSGLICSAKIKSRKFNLLANKLGNVAGVSLVTYSVLVSSSDHRSQVWDQNLTFYVAIASPCVVGLCIATWMTSQLKLDKPERVAVAVESCYQNTGIATSVAINMFQGDDLAVAVGVPLFYGVCEAVVLAVYCLGSWKLGWTKAPRDEKFCVVLTTSYEVEEAERHAPNAIEVVLGFRKEGLPADLVFSAIDEGYEIDEVSLHSITASCATEYVHKDPRAERTADETSSPIVAAREVEITDDEVSPAFSTEGSEVGVHGRMMGRTYSPLETECCKEETVVHDVALSAKATVASNEIGSSSSSRFGRVVASFRARGSSKYPYKMASDDEAGEVCQASGSHIEEQQRIHVSK